MGVGPGAAIVVKVEMARGADTTQTGRRRTVRRLAVRDNGVNERGAFQASRGLTVVIEGIG
jgi:hypothetical protein